MRKSKCCHQQTRPLNHKIIKKFCHICKKKFHDVDDNRDDSDDASDFDMMRNLVVESFVAMLKDLMVMMVAMAMIMIVMMIVILIAMTRNLNQKVSWHSCRA